MVMYEDLQTSGYSKILIKETEQPCCTGSLSSCPAAKAIASLKGAQILSAEKADVIIQHQSYIHESADGVMLCSTKHELWVKSEIALPAKEFLQENEEDELLEPREKNKLFKNALS